MLTQKESYLLPEIQISLTKIKSFLNWFFRTILETLVVLIHGAFAHTHTAETTVVEKILHGHFFGQIRKQCDAVIGAVVGRSIAQRRHAIGKIEQRLKAENAAAGRSWSR